MQKLTVVEAMRLLCEATGKYGMYVNTYFPEEATSPYLEVTLAAPYLTVEEDGQLIGDGVGIILFDTEQEMEAAYWDTVLGYSWG